MDRVGQLRLRRVMRISAITFAIISFVAACASLEQGSDAADWETVRPLIAGDTGDLETCDRLEEAFAYLKRSPDRSDQIERPYYLDQGPRLSARERDELGAILASLDDAEFAYDSDAITGDYRPGRVTVFYDDSMGARVKCS